MKTRISLIAASLLFSLTACTTVKRVEQVLNKEGISTRDISKRN